MRKSTFATRPGSSPLRCINCGALEAEHRWRCDSCKADQMVDANGLPYFLCCGVGATLYCVPSKMN